MSDIDISDEIKVIGITLEQGEKHLEAAMIAKYTTRLS